MTMAEQRSSLWGWLTRGVPANRQIEVVLDRRKGERRRRVEAVHEERRREDRRSPESGDLGELNGFLGDESQFKGDVGFRGALRIDGRLEGTYVRGEALVVGEGGQVDAEIHVERLQVSGHVRGNITAKRWVELLETSQVTGTIRTPRLTIWRGAVFNGTCEMPTALHHGHSTVQPEEERAAPPNMNRE
jgi:cytoskeletal protein CcmA (bactofilin family)